MGMLVNLLSNHPAEKYSVLYIHGGAKAKWQERTLVEFRRYGLRNSFYCPLNVMCV